MLIIFTLLIIIKNNLNTDIKLLLINYNIKFCQKKLLFFIIKYYIKK